MQPELPKEASILPVSQSSKICLGILLIWFLRVRELGWSDMMRRFFIRAAAL